MDIKNNNERIESLKSEIISLFKELLQEPKGRYALGSGYRVMLAPDSYYYCKIADSLIDKALELASYDSSIISGNLGSTLHREIDSVRTHKYQYEKDGKPTVKSKMELEHFMNKANCQLKQDLYEILKNVSLS